MNNKKTLKNTPKYFAGANTGNGFVSFYDSVFCESDLAGLYIIKGGPGTGKSTFMKRLGNIAATAGYNVTQCLCGSDSNSLDGVIISDNKGKKVGVIDGTPPHPKEFRSPGAAGDLLDFGEFWDSRALRKERSKIDSISREKSKCFETAYRYLGAARKIDYHIGELAEKFYLREKAQNAIKRLLSHIDDTGDIRHIQLSGYTMNGYVQLSPEVEGRKDYVIYGNRNIAEAVLCDIADYIKNRGISADISFYPIDMKQVDGIFLPESKIWIYYGSKDDPAEKYINTARFIDSDIAAVCRQKIRFGNKCKNSLIEGALKSLASAKTHHFSLEEIYKTHMDYNALNVQSEIWYKEILSRLD